MGHKRRDATAAESLQCHVRPNTPAMLYWLHPVEMTAGAKTRGFFCARAARAENAMHHCMLCYRPRLAEKVKQSVASVRLSVRLSVR